MATSRLALGYVRAKVGCVVTNQVGQQGSQGFFLAAFLGQLQQVGGKAALPPLRIHHHALPFHLMSSLR